MTDVLVDRVVNGTKVALFCSKPRISHIIDTSGLSLAGITCSVFEAVAIVHEKAGKVDVDTVTGYSSHENLLEHIQGQEKEERADYPFLCISYSFHISANNYEHHL